MKNSLGVAARAKGVGALWGRTHMIVRRYGLTPQKIQHILTRFVQVLAEFDCPATFPATAVAIQRNPNVLKLYQDQGIEFAVHGLAHVDYALLPLEEQIAHLHRARQVFSEAGLRATGFRSPYLSRNDSLYTALETVGFNYVSNQSMIWNVLDLQSLPLETRQQYELALAFYQPCDAQNHLVLPCIRGSLVEIPVSLPDDEILLDRLHGEGNSLVKRAWSRILAQTHRRGELFTIQLHPERIMQCADDLASVLRQARSLRPAVWCARLDEIAAWWMTRAAVTVTLASESPGAFRITINGPKELTVLARGVTVDAPTAPWVDGYQLVTPHTFTIHATQRPCIGVSAATDPALVAFLQAEGYLVEFTADADRYALYLDHPMFALDEELTLVDEIEACQPPLVRLWRWPEGCHSVVAVTGDIDAFTMWDYVLRFVGR